MVTEKDIQFVQFLLDSAQKGKLQWQPSAEQGQFTTTLQQKYTVYITKGSGVVTLVLVDNAGQELVSVNQYDIPPVDELYEFVRRQALDVDSVLDQIMRPRNLVITAARYGFRDHRVDVTKQLNDAIVNDKLHVLVGNQLAGDPSPNTPKDIVIEYRFKNQTLNKTAKEGDTLDLP